MVIHNSKRGKHIEAFPIGFCRLGPKSRGTRSALHWASPLTVRKHNGLKRDNLDLVGDATAAVDGPPKEQKPMIDACLG